VLRRLLLWLRLLLRLCLSWMRLLRAAVVSVPVCCCRLKGLCGVSLVADPHVYFVY
jgi:hypothetical protein